MELTKVQRALLTTPSRWPPIMLGIILSLFISAIFTCNFAVRVAPVPESTSPTSGSPWRSSPASAIATLSTQFFRFLFRNSHPKSAAPRGDDGNAGLSSKPLQSPMVSSPSVTDTNTSSSSPSSKEKMWQRTDKPDVVPGDVHANISLPPQEAVPPKKSVEAGSLSGRNMSVEPEPALNSTGTSELNTTGGSLTLEFHQEATELNVTETSQRVPSTSQHLVSDVKPVLEKQDEVQHVDDQPPTMSLPLAPSNRELCDTSVGQWVEDESYPLYHPGTCPFVDEGFSCQRNGRPDSKYNRWRWAPRDCIIPRFNGTALLERLRGKRLVFVGDSLNRNQWESMLCMLRESLPDKRRIVQVNGGRISKLPGAYVFKFLDYECKVEFYASHYLVDEEGENESDFRVRLDKMDKSERRWRKASVLVFNTGHWWTPDKIGEGDNRFQEGSTVHEKMDISVAYTKALSTWAKWVDTYVNPRDTTVFFRGYSPVHYIGGRWNSGGQCQDETEPIFNESFLAPYPMKMQVLDEILQEVKLPVQVLNVTRLSDFRKDAHPATYGHPPGHVTEHQDCSHWCLPGVPDTWNELLYFALRNKSV